MFKKILLPASFALLLSGCGSSGGLLMKHLNTSYLPAVQKDARHDKEILEYGKRCLTAAKDIEEANRCNAKVRKMDPYIDIDDFDHWDEKEKTRVIAIIDENLEEVDCILSVKNIEEALERCE